MRYAVKSGIHSQDTKFKAGANNNFLNLESLEISTSQYIVIDSPYSLGLIVCAMLK